MQYYINIFLESYGWEGMALAAAILLLLGVQLYYYLLLYSKIPNYKNNQRASVLESEPPVSVIIPLFSEDITFVEERLPLMLAQEYHAFEVVVVYVGQDTDFFADLERLKQSFPHFATTKIQLDPRFPISRKMALNVGIKSAHYEHMIFSSTEASPQTNRWLALMAKGFVKGDVVLGYCALTGRHALAGYLMHACSMMQSVEWIASAVRQRPYRGTLHNMGFTKSLYFGSHGFTHLNMNIGEDDLFLQKIMTRENVSVILSPRATLCQRPWGGLRWWISRQRYFGAAYRFYPERAKNSLRWEIGSRLLFFATIICALSVMPFEYKLAALSLLLLRYGLVVMQVARIGRRLGEKGICGRYFLYDLLSPLFSIYLSLLLIRKDERVWK